MEKATRALNVLSAIIMIVTGAYIHETFGPVLSPIAVGILWMTVAVYTGLQIENGYDFFRRKWRSESR
jgi:hypothetical protein